MSWYYNRANGTVFEATGFQKQVTDAQIMLEKGQAALGVPELFYGPFATQADANAFAANNPTYQSEAAKAVQAPVTDVTSAIAAAANTAVRLSMRVLEGAVGIVLLAIAANAVIKRTTGVSPAGEAVKAGKTAGKAAATAAVV
jgi:hypothetical protein